MFLAKSARLALRPCVWKRALAFFYFLKFCRNAEQYGQLAMLLLLSYRYVEATDSITVKFAVPELDKA